MKIKLEIELEIPDECKEWSDGELSQYIFDGYTNYVTCEHSLEAVQWCVAMQRGEETGTHLFNWHKSWHNIAKAATCKIIVL